MLKNPKILHDLHKAHQLPLVKRTWVYLGKPISYDMSPCECGEHGVWSEYQKHLWCERCEIDFVPERGGVFDGPIPVRAAMLMGITFDRYNLETEQVERFNPETLEYTPKVKPAA